MKTVDFTQHLLNVQSELFRFAFKLTADREEANDLLQEFQESHRSLLRSFLKKKLQRLKTALLKSWVLQEKLAQELRWQ